MEFIDPKTEQPQAAQDECVYEAPAIIYEGLITTRAGSTPTGATADEEASGVDLFGE